MKGRPGKARDAAADSHIRVDVRMRTPSGPKLLVFRTAGSFGSWPFWTRKHCMASFSAGGGGFVPGVT
jgi:hypothetical protein